MSDAQQFNPPFSAKSLLSYRPELDGLRGFALILVMGFHAQINGFSGGFLGVDIFFVLSGYLITRLIGKQILEGSFSLSAFYLRRAWRLLPSLWVVIFVSFILAYFLLSPMLLKDFGQSIMASLLFVSNFLFWHESGYFQAESLDKILIHTWSLGVEEQFYLSFPLLLLWAYKPAQQQFLERRALYTLKHLWCLIGIFILSLAFSEWAWRLYPSLNYYLPFSRLWTFATGALIAFYEMSDFKRPFSFHMQMICAWLGSLGLVTSLLLYEDWMPSPSLFTILPVFSTALLLIGSQAPTVIKSILCFRPLRYLGLMSYSAYLWHQPCLALSRQYFIQDQLSSLQTTLTLSLALFLAYLSYTFIEKPYRRSDLKLSHTQSALTLIGSSLILISLGAYIHLSEGIKNRLSSQTLLALNQIRQQAQVTPHPCPYKGFYRCQLGAQTVPATYALIGDSHAGMYAQPFDQALSQNDLGMAYAGDGWCVPLLNFYTDDFRKNNQVCHTHMSKELKNIAINPQIHTVFLAAEWTHYITGQRYGSSVSRYHYSPVNASNTSSQLALIYQQPWTNNKHAFAQALSATLKLFTDAHKRIVMIAPVPEYSFSVPQRMSQLSFRELNLNQLNQELTHYKKQHQIFFEMIQAIKQQTHSNVVLWQVSDQLCQPKQSKCHPYQEPALPLYIDSNHLSLAGASKVVEQIMNSGLIQD